MSLSSRPWYQMPAGIQPQPLTARRPARPWNQVIPALPVETLRRREALLGTTSDLPAKSGRQLPSIQNGERSVSLPSTQALLPRSFVEKATFAARRLSPTKFLEGLSRLSPPRSRHASPNRSPQRAGPSSRNIQAHNVLAQEVAGYLADGSTTVTKPIFTRKTHLRVLLKKLEDSFPKYDDDGQPKAAATLCGGTGAKAVRNTVVANFVQVSKLLAKYDADGSGDIDKKEFVALILSLLGGQTHMSSIGKDDLEAFFDEFDADKSGTISQREFKAQIRAEARPKPLVRIWTDEMK